MRPSAGQLVGAALTTVWRPTPEPLDMTPETLSRLVPPLLQSGAAALVWRRIRHTPLHTSPATGALQERYRLVAARATLYRRDLVSAVTRLRAVGVEAVLVKGWAIARLYPDPELRPGGDLDLCVPRADYSRARTALADWTGVAVPVDLHEGFRTLDDEEEAGLFERSVLVDCGGVAVRVLAPEDHLRVLCRHLLRHGATRPLWLCDVAVAVEERLPDFDWGRCLTASRRVADWVSCTVGLAHRLLGCRVTDTPVSQRATRLPRWLVPVVLREWGKGYRPLAPLADQVRRPIQLVSRIPAHWPNGIQATVALRGTFTAWPRLPYQIAACAPGAMRVVRRARRRERAPGP